MKLKDNRGDHNQVLEYILTSDRATTVKSKQSLPPS